MVSRGGYELIGRVGQGSTGTVWKARDVRLGRDVALKQVAVGFGEGAERLRTEAARLAGLADEHVVEVFGFFTEGGDAYLVEQWIDGATLAAVLASGASFSTAQALGVCRGALLGLAHAHRRRVVHGDVSASNVLIDIDGVSRLIDFGFAGSGTPAYRAPEVVVTGDPSPAADVFSAALVLVRLLTGAADRTAVDRVDAGLRPVLDRALALDPANRYENAGAFLAALDEAATRRFGPAWWTQAGVGVMVAPAVAVLTGVGGGSSTAAVATAVASSGGRSAPRLWIAAAAATVVVIGGVAVAVATLKKDDHADASAAPAAKTATPKPTHNDSPAEVLQGSVPSGQWQLTTTIVRKIHRDGSVAPSKEKAPVIVWTFSDPQCSGVACSGTISSSSGRTFPYRWDGTALDVTRPATSVIPKAACVDNATGKAKPIEESADQQTYHSSYQPFRGSSQQMVSRYRDRISNHYFGTCGPVDDDVVAQIARQVIVPLP